MTTTPTPTTTTTTTVTMTSPAPMPSTTAPTGRGRSDSARSGSGNSDSGRPGRVPRAPLIALLRRGAVAAAWACLALGLATLGLWGRSYWVGDRLARKTAGPVGDAWRSRQIILESRLGRLACSVHTETVWPPAPPGPPSASWRWITEGNPRRPTYLADRSWLYRQMGFSATTLRSEGGSPFGPPRAYRGLFLAAPYWSVALLLSIPPALGWWRRPARQRRRRAAAGLCPRCGYDLRASPGRCPECGAQRDEP